MLKIRLQRVGRKNDPSFRVVLTELRKAASKGAIELLGSYDARQGKPTLNGERIKYWISVGAKPSDTVHNLLVSEKVIVGEKRNVLPKKSPIKKENSKEEEKKREVPTDEPEKIDSDEGESSSEDKK